MSETYPSSFEVVDIVKEELRKMIARFEADEKPSFWPTLGSPRKPTKLKVAEVLHKSAEGEIDDLKSAVENLEVGWKQKHGPVCLYFRTKHLSLHIIDYWPGICRVQEDL